MGKRFNETLRTIKFVLSRRKYLLTTIFSSVLVFAALYYLIVAKVADNELWISVMMSGAGYVTFSIVSIALISALFGIYLSMVVFKISMIRTIGGGGLFGAVGGTIGAFGVGCPTCGAFLFGLIGAPFALMYLPFKGLELQVLGVFVLAFSIYLTSKSINAKCKINYREF